MKRHNDQTIREVLAEFSLQKPVKNQLLLTKIKTFWKQNMAFGINQSTQKIDLKNNLLILHITSAPLRQELLIHKDLIITKLNNHLGATIIKEIRLVGS